MLRSGSGCAGVYWRDTPRQRAITWASRGVVVVVMALQVSAQLGAGGPVKLDNSTPLQATGLPASAVESNIAGERSQPRPPAFLTASGLEYIDTSFENASPLW